MTIDIRRNSQRFLTEADGKSTRHSFSYGAHYDPEQIGFGPIRAINTERLDPGAGYEAHRHSDVEIITWIIDGALHHRDSTGEGGIIRPGTAQRLSAGDGAEHSEYNASDEEPLTFIQMMLASDREGAPEYASAEVPPQTGTLLPTVDVHASATLFIARLERDQAVLVPAAARCLVHVARGTALVRDQLLHEGDEARLTAAGPFDLRAGSLAAEVLIWVMD